MAFGQAVLKDESSVSVPATCASEALGRHLPSPFGVSRNETESYSSNSTTARSFSNGIARVFAAQGPKDALGTREAGCAGSACRGDRWQSDLSERRADNPALGATGVQLCVKSKKGGCAVRTRRTLVDRLRLLVESWRRIVMLPESGHRSSRRRCRASSQARRFRVSGGHRNCQ